MHQTTKIEKKMRNGVQEPGEKILVGLYISSK
jgi:hypothetical protein